MRSASPSESSYLSHPSAPSRMAAVLLALAFSLLIVLMLLKMGVMADRKSDRATRPIVVQLLPEAGKTKAQQRPQAKQARAQRKSRPVPPPIPVPPVPKLNMVMMSHEDFVATDISRVSPSPSQVAANTEANASSGAAEGPGQGPGGQRLYDAEWYREPTNAELATYLPHGIEGQWAMIACRTIERYHVDDCQELAESPPGTGLARGLKEAAWQFLVRPPRVGGKSMVGAWVRIRFDFKEEKTK